MATDFGNRLQRLIDTDKPQAYKEIYIRVEAVVGRSLPPKIQELRRRKYESEVDSWLSDLFHYLTANNFKVVRQWRDTGRGFDGWLKVVALRFSLKPVPGMDKDTGHEDYLGESKPSEYENKEAVEIVCTEIGQMSEKCQILLRFTASGYEPRDIQELFDFPGERNKALGTAKSACVKKLRDKVKKRGLSV